MLGINGFVSYEECYTALKKLYPKNDVKKDEPFEGVLPSITMTGYVVDYEAQCIFHFSRDSLFNYCQCSIKSFDVEVFLEMLNQKYGNSIQADTLDTYSNSPGKAYVFQWLKEDLKVELIHQDDKKEIDILYDFIDTVEFNDKF